MAHLEDLLGKEVTGKDGNSVSVSSLEANDLLGIYFSAHWCSPCRCFTPTLAECYNKVTSAGKKWEIIFISLDKDEESCKQYYESMPWLLFPFESDLKETLADKYEVTGIPTLLLLDPKSGERITDNGQDLVEKDPSGEKFPWN
uniref:Thioredoxin domain-containing protein n=1 Tax=Arion vulgaris TaxID=1028688 RepID=A0A0B7BK01_9EUPU